MGLYLYALAPDSQLSLLATLAVSGLDQQPLEFFHLSPLVVVYSQAKQERYLASRANLLAHEAAIEQVMHLLEPQVPLPLQFGLVINTWEQLHQDLIEPHLPKLEQLLAKLAGKREVGIKLFWDQLQEINLLLAENTALNQKRQDLLGRTLTMDQAIDIGQELEAGLEARQQQIVSSFLTVLRPLCHEYVEGELLTENMLYNASFLIDQDREPEFAKAIATLDQEFDQRLRIRYNNFTAPFNFASF
ncbi:MAG: GvpL/GvpF family gas vesicle protein [Pseudanabaenaceae cyanobacterium bins.68]|nr:GvpL/GvpF family gas vesicle protein [Pseudanabaenaceae cyanobacterium bins.68]